MRNSSPLDANSVEVAAKAIAEAEYEAVAVSLIHSYVDPFARARDEKHPSQESFPDIPIVLSHEVAPEWREYERTSSTVTSVYITPRVRDYLYRLSVALRDRGLSVPLHITQSNGGAMIADSAADRAVLTLYSGPVGGVIGGREVGRLTDQPDLICIDMGGTSFDVSIVRGGQVGMQSEFELQGLPILAPAVELVSIGAGGGSLIYERHGGLRVGPESAGSFPGPASYGRGGVRPTVSDANVVLGRIPRAQKLAGSFTLDRQAAEDALASVAGFFDLTATELAEQALDVTHFVMAEAIRELTVERGLHPKDFAIVAFGGAGPLHAAFLAEELEVERVLIPANPGVFSAWGMLQGDVRHDAVTTHYRRLDQPIVDLTEPIERPQGHGVPRDGGGRGAAGRDALRDPHRVALRGPGVLAAHPAGGRGRGRGVQGKLPCAVRGALRTCQPGGPHRDGRYPLDGYPRIRARPVR